MDTPSERLALVIRYLLFEAPDRYRRDSAQESLAHALQEYQDETVKRIKEEVHYQVCS